MKPGSIVVCVNDTQFSPHAVRLLSALPVRNRLYIVREIIPNFEVRNGPPGVALEEIYGKQINLTSYTGAKVTLELHFKMKRFKEVLPPMSLEAVNHLLCGEPELVPVEV